MHFNLTGLCLVRRKAAFFSEHKTLVFLMRAGFVYIVIGLFSMTMLFAHVGKGQSLEEIKVTIELDNETLPQLFKKIQDQTTLVFGYRQQEIDKVSPLTLGNQTLTVKVLLDLVFEGTSLQYKQVNSSVIVFEKEPEPLIVNSAREQISGTVTDKSGSPLPGVSIFIKGTTTGTVSDSNGKYIIDAKDEDILVFSFIGYKSFETSPAARVIIDVIMEEDTKVLGEVVISGGYYETTDRLKTGNIVKITAKDIERQPVTSPIMALQGQVAGLDIISNGGTPGSAPRIRIRGDNSLRTQKPGTGAGNGNRPLYVIDGVPISSAGVRLLGGGELTGGNTINYDYNDNQDPLSSINPSDIESFEILKDGDATAIYGSRGANGVILVTTKQNKKSIGRTNLDVVFSTGAGRMANRVDLLSTQQYVAMRKEAFANEGLPITDYAAPDLTKWDTTRYTDWQDVLLGGTATITDIQVGISSGTKNTSFRFNTGYHKETLVTPGDFGFQRFTGSLSVNHTSNDERFRISLSANYGVSINELFTASFVTDALTLPPNAPELYDAEGNINWEIHDLGTGFLYSTWRNPVAGLLNKFRSVTRTFMTNANLSYELVPGISISTAIGMNTTDAEGLYRGRSESVQPTPGNPVRYGAAGIQNDVRSVFNIEPQVVMHKSWNDHQLDFLVGATLQRNRGSIFDIAGTEYVSNALLGSLKAAGRTVVNFDESTEYNFASLYSRLGYNFGQKYLLNLTARRDGSSRFGPGKRFGNFWSVGSAWIFTEEKLVKENLTFLTFGKIRASYGVTGSDNILDYGFYNLYDVVTEKYQGLAGSVPWALYNPDYAWEETHKLEGALEMSFFKARLSTEIAWYRNRTSNQLVQYPLPATSGFSSVSRNFDATVQNSGWEFLVRGAVITNDNWNWNMSVNLSIPQNKLIKFEGIEDSPYATIYKVGEPLSIRYLYTFKGLNSETGLYEVEDKNNDGKYNDQDRSLMNNTDKSMYGGWMNTVQYKGLEFSINFYFTKWQIQRFYGDSPGVIVNQPAWVLSRWQQPGDITSVQKYGFNDASYHYDLMKASNYNITDASFIRLRTLTIAYLFPLKWTERVKLQQAKIYLQGQNLFTLTRYEGLDPETGSGSLPPLQMLTLGLQLKL